MQYPVVPLKRNTLAIYDEDAADSPELASELRMLTAEHEAIIKRVAEVTSIIDVTVEILNKHNSTLSEEVDTYATFLQAQLDIEEDDAANSANYRDFFDDDDFSDMDEEFAEEMAKDDTRNTITNRDLRRTAKALFKKIANLSHPDKVGHDRFVDIYKEAYDASELCDISRLQEILKSLKEAKSSIRSIRKRMRRELELRIAELQTKIKRASLELKDLVESDEYDYSRIRIEVSEEQMVAAHQRELKKLRHILRTRLSGRGFDPDNLPL